VVLPICMNYAYIHSTVFPSLLPAVDWFWFGPESDWWKEPPARLQSCPCQVGKSLVGHRRDTRFRCWWSQVDVEGLSGLSVRETLCLARTFGLVVVDTPYAPGKSTEPIRSQTSSRKWRTALRLPRRPPEAGVGGGHALAGYQVPIPIPCCMRAREGHGRAWSFCCRDAQPCLTSYNDVPSVCSRSMTHWISN
jgi:hypothetical protein